MGSNSPVTAAGKCAASMAAENLHFVQKILACRYYNILWGRMDFPHELRFSAGIGPAHFLAETTRPLGPRLSAFSASFISHICLPNGNGNGDATTLKVG